MVGKSLKLLAITAVLMTAAGTVVALAETVKPLEPKDCDQVRAGLEDSLPFGPGFRRMQIDFPKNAKDIDGKVCRLLTLGTGIHMEGPKVNSLAAMVKLVQGAMTDRGWLKTPDTSLFAEKSMPGRQVFALTRKNAFCVTTVVIDMVGGITLSPKVVKNGKVMLGKLKPHQREWWISVDCFAVPEPPKPMAEAGAGEKPMPAMKTPAKPATAKKPPVEEEEIIEEPAKTKL
ncbi:MAG: hypothetical protein HQ512_02330 [Rhodospirillales bacterium]|nr:hypothetical protein [Rhodospirillales bacterium]